MKIWVELNSSCSLKLSLSHVIDYLGRSFDVILGSRMVFHKTRSKPGNQTILCQKFQKPSNCLIGEPISNLNIVKHNKCELIKTLKLTPVSDVVICRLQLIITEGFTVYLYYLQILGSAGVIIRGPVLLVMRPMRKAFVRGVKRLCCHE